MSQRNPVPGSTQSTIVEQKQHFLQTRKHILSRGIPPSERLRTLAQDGGIELSVMKGVLDKGAYLLTHQSLEIKAQSTSSQP
jgi:hypothetical protein